MLRTLTRRQQVADVAVAVALFVLAALPTLYVTGSLLVLFGMCVAMVYRRLRPGIALGIAWAVSLLQMAAALTPEYANILTFAVLFATSAYGNRAEKWLGLASTVVGAFFVSGYLVIGPQFFGLSGGIPSLDQVPRLAMAFLASLALFLLAWTLGFLARTYGNARASGEARARAEGEKERATQTVAVEQERTRIARDMHDVVAHSLAVVIAQADGARYAAASDPTAVDSALTTISSTAREALGDVRILLGQLRHDEAPGPQPVLDDLERLIVQLQGSGLVVEHRSEGEQVQLGVGAQLAVYRIVQEALTNALRHGDGAVPTRLTMRWTADGIEVTVANRVAQGRGADGPDGAIGHGLVGMRERAVLAGGTFSAMAVGGEFVVTASVPRTARAATDGGTA
ncbi:sensor histidine kinase [Marisediminicola senii]|uniref:sensor histidine kinase n=1 Tax=Marisediminicola senii TaxID=2711233 RepID=UPI0013E9AB64|nr:histidine kinase [Marisediminicola senii]